LHIFWNSSCSCRNCTLLARRQLIDVADLLAKEPKDFDSHLIQTRYQVSDLTVNHQADALNPFQHLKHPPQGRTIGRLVELMRDRLVLTGSLPAQTTLCYCIDQ
jgi:hypothetical protein